MEEVFSIGFGKERIGLLIIQEQDGNFLLPLGGYVKTHGDDEASTKKSEEK